MSVEQVLKLNEKYKENRPKSPLVCLAAQDADFVQDLDVDLELPSVCPSNILKIAIKDNYQELLKSIPAQALIYISTSTLMQEEQCLEENLKCVYMIYQKNYKMLTEMLQESLLEEFLKYINSFDSKKEIVVDNLYHLYSLNRNKWEYLAERIFLLDSHDKEFLKEPLLVEVDCIDAIDLLNKLQVLTKERFAIVRQFDKKNGVGSIRPAYIWEISKNIWKRLCDLVEKDGLELNLFRNLNSAQIIKFAENFENASARLKELCKKDSLAVTCILNDFKYEDFVLSSYMDNQKAMRETIVAFALANDKTRFLQLITNRSDLLHINRQATKLLMQEEVYTKCLDINTMHVEDFTLLSKWEFTDWPEFKEIDELLTMDEFKAVLGKPKQYIHFVCESKRKGLVNVEAVEELYKNGLLSESIIKSRILAQQLNGKKLSDVYNEFFYDTGIGFRNVIKLIVKCGLSKAAQARNIWDALMIFEEFQEEQVIPEFTMDTLLEEKRAILLQNPVIAEYRNKYTTEFDKMISRGIVSMLDTFSKNDTDENVRNYLLYLIHHWCEGDLKDLLYAPENMHYELEYDIPSDMLEFWALNTEISIGDFTIKEIDSLEEKMMLCCKMNTRYSYKNDKSASLSIMDATKKLIGIYHCDDCIGVATLRLTKLGGRHNNGESKELLLYLSNVMFVQNISYGIMINALKMIIRLAMQKSCSMGCVLALEEKYGSFDLGIDTLKVSEKIFNNRSRNPIQFFGDNQYRGSWDSLKTYTHTTFRWLK